MSRKQQTTKRNIRTAKIKDDDTAKSLFAEAQENARTAKPAPPCATCERVRHLMESWDEMDSINPQWNVGQQQCANELRAALGEVTP